MQSLQNAVAELKPTCFEIPASGNLPKQCHPQTYATAVSADILKNAVSEALKEQHKLNADRSSVVVYGFPEEGNDIPQLRDMLDFLGCRIDIIRSSRVGRSHHQTGNSSARPIKVELRSVSDVSIILSRANCLRDEAYYAGVHINKWLSQEEMKGVKALRSQCDTLNRERCDTSDHHKRKCYVVISGKIMKRDSSGRLQAYEVRQDSKSKNSSSAKNNVATSGDQQQDCHTVLSDTAKLSQSKNA